MTATTRAERPILFSGSMVRAILSGAKTQTRRPVKPQPYSSYQDPDINVGVYRPIMVSRSGAYDYLGPDTYGAYDMNGTWAAKSPFGEPGDRLWVRETFCSPPTHWAAHDDTCIVDAEGAKRYVAYRADNYDKDVMRRFRLHWSPSIHMPRWASRITLEIVDIRVERLTAITLQDIIAEGAFDNLFGCDVTKLQHENIRQDFACLWNSMYGNTYPWLDNPLVWGVTFRRIQ